MKYLVLGANGMAGHVISNYLEISKHEVFRFSRSDMGYKNTIIGDATDLKRLANILKNGDYDFIINCLGVLNEFCDKNPSQAILINSYIPHFIASEIKYTKTRLIQLSTDCVFSGKKGNYKETDLKDGLTFYDKTKSLSEIDDKRNLTFRNSIVGPDLSTEGIGLFNWFMKQEGAVDGYSNVFWSGVTTLTIAKAIKAASEVELTGIYHLTNNKPVSKFDLLTIFNDIFKDSMVSIEENSDLILDKSIVNTRSDFNFEVPSYKEMIEEMKVWIETNRELYPHYKI